jgi:hypothetical protein
MEADRRHTTTGFENRKSCSQSSFDLPQLVVDGYAETLKSPGRNVDIAGPGGAWNGGFNGLSQVARGVEWAPRHHELCDPASPSLFAVLPEDPLDLYGVRIVDDSCRRECRAGIHPHVERPVGAKAEAALWVVDLGAGETEVEEDQVGRVETVCRCDRAKLGKASVNDDRRGRELRQGHPSGLDRRGIAVDPQQPAARCDPLQDLAGVARLPKGAVDRDRPPSGLEQLYYLL